MATAQPEVHVGDVGTTYRVKLTDAGVPFDPTLATTKQILFRLPGGVVAKDADVDPTTHFLVYVVDDPAFHSAPGKVAVQAYLVFDDGSTYHSAIQTEDVDGNPLTIARNLA